jgi:serine/threonine protein kinase/Flp pilus assembly protein TadD
MPPTNFDDVVEAGDSPDRVEHLSFQGGMSMKVHDVRQGGMGVVYLGEISLPDGRSAPVAAKSIRQSLLLKPETRIAFLRETSIWAQLSGIPFVQPLLAVESLHGFAYLLTLRVEPDEDGAISLRDLIRLGPSGLPSAKIFEVALAVSTAMARAAIVVPELVHGDIKPDNILLLSGIPHVGDFGIAKAVQGDQTGRGLVGTLAYLAPEAFSGLLTVKSDLYAYGCMLYECLSGSLPFGDNSDVDVMRARHEAGCYPSLQCDRADKLRIEIAELAENCLRLSPDERPENFGVLAVRLYAFGMEHAPGVVDLVSRCCEASRTGGENPENLMAIEESRIEKLLQAGDPAAAVRSLEKIPEGARSPKLWMKAGSAYSLSGDDERALACFDRCSAATSDQELLTWCMSEKGLSLRRLGRHEEAIALYEDLIPRVGQEALLPVMGNFAGTLLDAGRIEDAVKWASWLIAKHRESPVAWMLLGQALRASGDFEKALTCFQRSIDRDPNAFLAQFEAAEIYQFEFGDLEHALAHLNAAFATGQHNPQLAARLLSVNMLLNRMEDVGGLLDALSRISKEVGNEITQMALEDVKKFMERFGEGKSDKESTTVPADCFNRQDGPNISNTPLVLETAILFEEGQKLPMIGCRAFVTSEMFAVDFYDQSTGDDYAASFGRCFAKFSRQIMVQFGNVHLRNSMLGMVHCTHCEFAILSNRDEDEKLLCRNCDKKGPVVFDRSPASLALVAACESKAGLTRNSVGDTPVLLSFWLPPGRIIEETRSLCAEEGWRSVGSDTLSPRTAAFLGRYYGATSSEEPSLQLIRELPAGEELYNGTPWSVQRVILAVHSRFGHCPSSSITLVPGITHYLEGSRESVYESICADLEKRPEDPESLAGLIELLAQNEIHRAGDLVAISLQLTNRDHPKLLAARGVYALRTGDLDAARQSLEEAKRRSPLDPTIRLNLIELWETLEMDEKAREEKAELRSIGFRLTLGP